MEFKGIIVYVVIFLFCTIVASPIIMNSIGKFGVQKRFAKDMVIKEVISEEYYKKVQRMQEVLAIIMGLIVISAIIYVGIINAPFVWIIIVAGVSLGCYLSRKSIQYSVVTFHAFKTAYEGHFDIDKYNEVANKFIEENNLKKECK